MFYIRISILSPNVLFEGPENDGNKWFILVRGQYNTVAGELNFPVPSAGGTRYIVFLEKGGKGGHKKADVSYGQACSNFNVSAQPGMEHLSSDLDV